MRSCFRLTPARVQKIESIMKIMSQFIFTQTNKTNISLNDNVTPRELSMDNVGKTRRLNRR